ncbi:MAG TPA: hypothetical protein VHU87_01525, partial [Rhizomicrobium sp.]|nr:hypothetical protein [Rhizomicrobium sp.]
DKAGCLMLSENAGCLMLADKAGCLMLADKAGCLMLSEKAGCLMLADKAGCLMLADKAGCLMLTEKAGCLMLSEKAGCLMLTEKAGCLMLSDVSEIDDADTSKPAQVARFYRRIDAWDMTAVKKQLVRKGVFTAVEVEAVHEEYKRFVALSCASADGEIPVSKRVDEFWHQHILFTQDYAAMCRAVAGHFLHHLPTDGE